MSKPTLGLCMIIKDEFDETAIAIAQLGGIVDEFFICCTGGKPLVINDPNVHITTFDWKDNFSDARNSIKPTTDYWLWMDADDLIVNRERLPEVIEHMERRGVEMMSAKYIYKTDEKTGLPTEIQKRERIIKTSLPGKWHGPIHETWIPAKSPQREYTEAVEWLHMKSDHGHKESMLRNRKILEDSFYPIEDDHKDPRIAYYLGLNYMMDSSFTKAIACFGFLVEHGGWDEERYRARLQIGSAYHLMGQFDNALTTYLHAALELPEWPDAYFLLQQIYWERDEHEKAIEWMKVGLSKPEPETESARNPIITQYQPVKYGAYSLLAVGKAAEAFQMLANLTKNAPEYPVEPELKDAIREAYNAERAIESAKYLIDYNESYEGDALAVLGSLPPTVRADIRLSEQRRALLPIKKWPKGSIVYWCGQSFEPWGPDTLDKGMGGSEEAVVSLSREFAEDGHEVTVFNERKELWRDYLHTCGEEDAIYTHAPETEVGYCPWTAINPNDEFDIFIAWRNPAELADIKARVKLCDLHDTLTPELVYHWAEHVDKYMVKSKWHRELYPDLPDDKFIVVGNGINKADFK